jgi:hypothetical protein
MHIDGALTQPGGLCDFEDVEVFDKSQKKDCSLTVGQVRCGGPHRLNLFINKSGKQVGPLVDLSWIPSGPSKDYMRVMASDADARLGRRASESAMPPVTNVVGWGVETDTQCVMDGDGKIEMRFTRRADEVRE